jgi:hypothetical protein
MPKSQVIRPPDRGLTSKWEGILGECREDVSGGCPSSDGQMTLRYARDRFSYLETYGAGIIAVATFESVLCSPLEFTAVTW